MLKHTLEELNIVQKEQLTKLLEHTGGANHLSKMLGVLYMTVRGWEERGRISKKGAKQVGGHKTLGGLFKAIDLRPDL